MTLSRLPLSTWGWFINAWVGLLAFAVLLPTCLLLVLDRLGGTSFFIPAGLVVNDKLLPHSGGSPLLFQHLFWFFGHPEVYIIILPAFGIIAHVMPTFTRKPLVGGWKVITYAMIAIGTLSFVVWGHHMFVSGMSPYMGMVFSVPTLIITIPSVIAVLVFAVSFTAPTCALRLRCCSASVSSRSSSAAESVASSWRNRRSIPICTRPASWWVISTSPWVSPPYLRLLLASTTGFRKCGAA